MWNGKKKAITFSYDDGVMQDIRFIELLNKYNLKGTFNINSSFLGLPGELDWSGVKLAHNIIKAEDVKYVYEGHEISVHTLTHPNLTGLSDTVITRQVEQDRLILSDLAGYEVIGMAYPCGGVNNDDRVAKIIKDTTGVKYSRTITSTHNFDLQSNLYRFNPTVYHIETDKMFELATEFIEADYSEPHLLYVWGHTYELDRDNGTPWDQIEELFKLISGKNDIFYGTNKQVLLDID